jgi:hypothetical protein
MPIFLILETKVKSIFLISNKAISTSGYLHSD